MNQLSEVEKSYIAGLIDGEGCLTISKYQGKNNATPVYFGQVIISMTNKKVLEWVVKTTGMGRIYYTDKKSEVWCSVYRWCDLKPLDCLYLLMEIVPYLIVKSEEAKTLIDFFSLPKRVQRGKRPIALYYVSQREEYYQRMQDLKTCGKGISEDNPVIEPDAIIDPQLPLGLII